MALHMELLISIHCCKIYKLDVTVKENEKYLKFLTPCITINQKPNSTYQDDSK